MNYIEHRLTQVRDHAIDGSPVPEKLRRELGEAMVRRLDAMSLADQRRILGLLVEVDYIQRKATEVSGQTIYGGSIPGP